MRSLIKKILKEEIDEKVVNLMVNSVRSGLVEPPYIKNLGEDYTLDSKEIYSVLRQIFNSTKIKVSGYGIEVYDEKGRDVYYENPENNDWEQKKYSDDGKKEIISYPDGWEIWEYDDKHNTTYYENNSGLWVKYEYDEKGREVYRENSEGYWKRFGYDKKGDINFREDSLQGITLDKR